MGVAQVAAAEGYQKAGTPKDAVESGGLSFVRFPVQALVNTGSADCHITDSAAAGTAIATGEKTNCGRISMSAEGTALSPTMAELAHRAGMKTGIITTVPLTHATPAVFYAHVPSRRDFSEIGRQMIESDIDFFGGGGFSALNRQKKNKSTDSPPVDFFKEAQAHGYHFIDVAAAMKDRADSFEKSIAIANDLTPGNSMPYEIDRQKGNPSLADITHIGITQLSNDKGFFMMVEGGKIDWAAHDNDLATMIHEVIAFNDAVDQALAFYSRHPENTLILVTADHETGGLALGNGREKNLDYNLIAEQRASYELLEAAFSDLAENKINLSTEDILLWMQAYFGEDFPSRLSEADLEIIHGALRQYAINRSNTENEPPNGNYSKDNPVVKAIVGVLNDKAGFAWGSSDHTAVPVPLFAIGAGSEAFAGVYENTAIFEKIAALLKIETLP